MGHAVDAIADNLHYVADAAAVATGDPEFVPAIEGANSGIKTYRQTGSLGDALKSGAGSAAGSYLGAQIGGNLLGSQLGTVGSTATNALGTNAFSSFVGNSLGSELGNVGIGSLLGGAIGNSVGTSLTAPKTQPQNSLMDAASPASAAFKPSQQAQSTLPASLASMSTLTDNQKATNLATQGTYGGGVGPQEQNYFLNLENRKLVDPQGQVGQMSNLSPIEQSYLQQLGLGGFSDPTSLLEAISKRAA